MVTVVRMSRIESWTVFPRRLTHNSEEQEVIFQTFKLTKSNLSVFGKVWRVLDNWILSQTILFISLLPRSVGWIRPSQQEREDEWAEEKFEQEVGSEFQLSSTLSSSQKDQKCFRIEEFGELDLPSSSSSSSFASFASPVSDPQPQLYLKSPASGSSLYSQVPFFWHFSYFFKGASPPRKENISLRGRHPL